MHFLQQKMRLLLTHLKHLVSHLPNPAVHELCRGETHPTGLRSCEAPVPGHKLMCTAAPQHSFSLNQECIRAAPLDRVPVRTGSGAINPNSLSWKAGTGSPEMFSIPLHFVETQD